MPGYFFDTSALAKLYHPETGTGIVDQISRLADSRIRISRLTMIELRSVFAIKVRTGFISRDDSEAMLRQLREDAVTNKFDVFAVRDPELSAAERLTERYAFDHRLRSLDAVQLAVALRLKEQSMADYFVASDKALCEVAALEGFSVINPEQP